MSFTHMIILGIIALIVIPPEKLPELAREIARFISELKNSADQIMGELKRDAVFKPDDILDKDIKAKLAELQKDINKTVSLKPAEAKVSTPAGPESAQPPAAAASVPSSTSSGTSSDSNGGGQA